MLIINVSMSKISNFEEKENCRKELFRKNEISKQQQQFVVNGTLKLVNTIEEFKTFDIDQALKTESSTVRGENDFFGDDDFDFF